MSTGRHSQGVLETGSYSLGLFSQVSGATCSAASQVSETAVHPLPACDNRANLKLREGMGFAVSTLKSNP